MVLKKSIKEKTDQRGNQKRISGIRSYNGIKEKVSKR
jgi:hypothetical protein